MFKLIIFIGLASVGLLEIVNSNGDISATDTDYPIHSMFGASVGFWESAVGKLNDAIFSWTKFNRYVHVGDWSQFWYIWSLRQRWKLVIFRHP